MIFRSCIPLAAALIASTSTAVAQEVRVFEMNPSTGFLVQWSATSNLGPMGAFLQSYSFSGDVVVDFDQNPNTGTARVTGARLRIPNTVVAALMSGGAGTVFWRDIVLEATSPDFVLAPSPSGATFATNLELAVSSGFALISPPFGPALQMPLDGTVLGSIPIVGAFPSVGPAQGMRIDGFQFDMLFSAAGWNGVFTHDVVSLDGTGSCPQPLPYCLSDSGAPGGGTELDVVGSTSVQVDNFVLSVTRAPANTFGVFFYGQRAGESLSGSGTVCVGGALTRLGVAPTSTAGDASMRVILAQHQTGAAALAPGTHHNFQFWHRAVAPSGSSWNFSNGVAVTFCP